MLKFFRRRHHAHRPLVRYETDLSVADTNPDLKIRNLLDDPALRRVMGLDEATVTSLVTDRSELATAAA